MKAAVVVPSSPFLTAKTFPHLGPLCLKRFVKEHSEHEVDVIDEEDITSLAGYDVIGFSCTTPQYKRARHIALNTWTHQKRVLGGPHATHYDVPLNDCWDYVVKGDGCVPFLDILNGVSPRDLPDDVNQMPYRDETLHNYKYYLDGEPTTVIMTSRGCPNRCIFCENARTRVRWKDPVVVKQEIEECTDLGFTGIMFFDDLFCINESRVKNLCEVIGPFDIKFRCFAHARNFTAKMAHMLGASGCVEVAYGAESMSQRVLDLIGKQTTVEQNYKIVQTAHEAGLRIKAFTMLGLPGDSEQSAEDLERFVVTSGIDDFDVSVFYPYQDTYLAKHAKMFGINVQDSSTDGYYKARGGLSEYAVSLPGFPADRIKYWQERILKHKRGVF